MFVSRITGYSNLKLLSDINRRIIDKDIKSAIERVGLDPNDKRTVKKYSLGMKQRLAIAQAIMEKPDVLLLDEPTNALDDSGAEMLFNICKEETARGAVVLICSHNSEYLNKLCETVYTMDKGDVSFFKRG
jgi:ABC-2 type transport system ATP-binding protein